jgi:hypothetical protein
MKKFRRHQRCTHRVVSEHRGGQDGWYDDPKKEGRESRSSNDVMRKRVSQSGQYDEENKRASKTHS